MKTNSITLRMDEDDSIRRAATFTAQLVREGVVFEAKEDIAQHPSAMNSVPALLVTFTGGF